MKIKILYLMILACAMMACEDETKPVDPIYEFIAFKGPSTINVNEFTNSEQGVPIVVELRAFKPYPEDIDVTFEISESNAAENVDFVVTPSTSVKIEAGKLVSEPIYVKTIDNASGSAEARSFEMRITSINKENIKIGLGISQPTNAAVTVNILDDECTETTGVFGGPLVNSITYDNGGAVKTATGVVTGNSIKVTGDLIDYSPLSNASITIVLNPQSEGSTKGTATFGEQEAGTDSDGYDYKFIQTGEGTYDVCSGSIHVEYDIYYWDGAWVFWYSVTNDFALE